MPSSFRRSASSATSSGDDVEGGQIGEEEEEAAFLMTAPSPTRAHRDRVADRQTIQTVTFLQSFDLVIFSRPLNILMLFCPLTALPFFLFPSFSNEHSTMLFVGSLLGLVPFAERLGFITDHLSAHTDPTVGALLNATFGNLSEIVFCVLALRDRLYRVVQLSLLGSILSNLLLVLGCGCLLGGCVHHVQHFPKQSGAVSPGLLLLSMSAITLPAALKFSGQEDDLTDEKTFSRAIAIVMVAMYGLFLYFQLRTHRNEFAYDDDDDDGNDDGVRGRPAPIHPPEATFPPATPPRSRQLAPAAALLLPPPPLPHSVLPLSLCLLWLVLLTFFLAALSDVLCGTIENFTNERGVNPVFVASVVIPVFGNAAEHASSVVFAIRGRMDVCLNIAIGSSVQIALLVIPSCVLGGWITGREFTLFFEGYETASLLATVVVVSFFLNGGTSNWLIGALLLGLYAIVAAGFWIHRWENVGIPEANHA